ncbi:M1 family metallopeptidase [Sulfidibacter corallicola]|uniref:M1 family metallopeptidase n=1 Tax=Sulfidibacter corallicola TaxID=2818388 RepID=A0A8A4TS11_SULCO|nr:M1 family metallopeptidase [Sulfidibacter corallicola]QTD52303.1 M1 family metallopeptidase [Sulfidibacter corallicola]
MAFLIDPPRSSSLRPARRKRAIAIALALICAILPLSGQDPDASPLSPRIANYRIDVALDAENHSLKGRQFLLWHNQTEFPTSELQFHLYMNAFRNNLSTYMKESGMRSLGEDPGAWGHIDVTEIRVQPVPPRVTLEERDGLVEEVRPVISHFDQPPTAADMPDVTDRMSFIWPDDGNVHDRTVMRIPLAEPLAPGEYVWVYCTFDLQLPDPAHDRTGALDDYFLVAQWFPKIGVFENGAWNCHQFHANSEFYADFGVYEVDMTVPAHFVLGASGVEVEVRHNNDGTRTHAYRAEDVHDFAWTTSPDFEVHHDKLGDISLRLLIQKEHAYQAQRHLDVVRKGLARIQELLGPYPYAQLTVVDPKPGAGATGGMEYPTLITAGTSYGTPSRIRLMEATIVHELAHQYFYGLLASNEFTEVWLDEGFTTYLECRVMKDVYGSKGSTIDLWDLRVNELDVRRRGFILQPGGDPMLLPVWTYNSVRSYVINAYNKPALALTTLEHYLGTEVMDDLLRTYVERFKFRHPKSEDFVALAGEVSGQDLGWFFDQLLHTNRVLDYTVIRVRSRPAPKPAGRDSEAVTLETGKYTNEVTVQRLGDFVFPVKVQFMYEDGATEIEHWAGDEPWKKFTFDSEQRLTAARVDPDNQIPMDANLVNNSRRRLPDPEPAEREATRWLMRFQLLLELFAW